MATLFPLEERTLGCGLLVVEPGEERLRVDQARPAPVSVVWERSEIAFAAARFAVRRFQAHPSQIVQVPDGSCCARCTGLLEAGDRIVRCAVCFAPYHAGPRGGGRPPLDCGAGYEPRCAGCNRGWREMLAPPQEWL